MTALLFQVLVEGLKLWNTKEGTKHLDRIIRLQTEWIEHYSKPRSQRSNNDLDEIEAELEIISKAWINYRKKENA